MRFLMRALIIIVCTAVIVIISERFPFSNERAQLFSWWLFSGDRESIQTPISERVPNSEVDAFQAEILAMLTSAEQDSLTQKVALAFADEFVEDPLIKEQLIIISFDHPDHIVRCELKKRLGMHHEIIVTAHSPNNTQSARFSTADVCVP